ncbi:MAG: MerR family DNA-binding transcriptional regulator [Paracoccus sp. (in: a-proteobacteria)]|uniref:MerR family transcriptional regulator n=1 Tax=Paracoccus sp. TaxID=267 RepID=UPI0026DEF768|nr:MerR family DNA-binding transcriptional regulator [Paracoccus sp. (in: a-proteobacteria)]MDO5630747.1 MerR family DNA-binding transcriptional regulator [Paracoccus sp. (in: a-proteobacteria)]
MPDSDLITFKDMCARFDVTPRTLRYYEYIELLNPKKVGRSRFYGPREVARMTLILRGRKFGFSLEDIRQWLDIYQAKGSKQQFAHFLTLADNQLGVIDQQIADLQSARADLVALREETRELLAQATAGA